MIATNQLAVIFFYHIKEIKPAMFIKLRMCSNKINIVDMWSNAVHTISSAGLALDSMNEIMETQKGNISVMMDDLREAASNIKEFSNEVRANPASLLNSKEQPVLEETL
jgi:hypothetical protein